MKQILKGKKILITAGPTWVPVDKVRVITNIFGGALGFIIAETTYRMGASVTLLMGPGRVNLPSSTNNFKIIKFKYFDEILDLVKKEVGSKRYDVIIHSAAIADYAPVVSEEKKIKSGKKSLIVKLKPTIKIVDLIKKIDPSIFLVKFKLEVDIPKDKLISIAYKSMLQSKADLIVANDFKTVISNHLAYIIDQNKNIKYFVGKKSIARGLMKIVAKKIL